MGTFVGYLLRAFMHCRLENRVDNSVRPDEGRHWFSFRAFFAVGGGMGLAGKSGPFYEELHSKALGDPNPRVTPPQAKMYS